MTERLLEKLDRLAKEANIKEITPEVRKFALLVREDVVAQWPQPAQQEPVTPTAVEMKNAAANLALMREMWGNADEPAAKVNDDGFIVETGLLLSPGATLYTSPPAQRKPLTDRQILADETLRYYFGQNGGAGPVSKQGRRVVDAIEAAHGIKENT